MYGIIYIEREKITSLYKTQIAKNKMYSIKKNTYIFSASKVQKVK